MNARGIDVVRAHLAKIPPATTVAEKRAQYDRAERAFPVPPDVAIKSVRAPRPPSGSNRPLPAMAPWSCISTAVAT